MPLPFLPLLGAAAKTLGASAFLRMGLSGASSALKGAKPVNIAALGRSLGTPVPSAAQIKTAQLASLGTAAGGATKALLGMPSAVFSSISAFETFGSAVLSRREQFAQFNAGIAQSFAKLQRQDTLLSIRGGAAVSGSTTALADSFMALREDTAPMKEAMMNLWNVAGLTLVQLARIGTKSLELLGFLSLLETLNTWLNTMFGSTGDGQGIQTTLKNQLKELRDLNRKVKEQPQQARPLTPDPVETRPHVPWRGFGGRGA